MDYNPVILSWTFYTSRTILCIKTFDSRGHGLCTFVVWNTRTSMDIGDGTFNSCNVFIGVSDIIGRNSPLALENATTNSLTRLPFPRSFGS